MSNPKTNHQGEPNGDLHRCFHELLTNVAFLVIVTLPRRLTVRDEPRRVGVQVCAVGSIAVLGGVLDPPGYFTESRHALTL